MGQTDNTPSLQQRIRAKTRLFGKKKNHRRVPTAQRVRTGLRLLHRLMRFGMPIFLFSFLFVAYQSIEFLVKKSTYFALTTVIVPHHLQSKKQELLRMAELRMGTNLLTLRLHQVASNIKKNKQIQSVRIVRELPNTLIIEPVFQQPVAIVRLDKDYLIDKNGNPFARSTPEHSKQGLLVLSGFHRTYYNNDPHISQTLFQQALAIKKLYNQYQLHRHQPLKEIQYDPIVGYILHTDKGRVYLGRNQYSTRLQRLQQLHKLFSAKGVKKFRYVYLNHERHPKRIIVRVMDAIPVAVNKKNTKDL